MSLRRPRADKIISREEANRKFGLDLSSLRQLEARIGVLGQEKYLEDYQKK